MARPDGRKPNELRPCEILVDFVGTADGSCLIRCGGTRVICTASVEEGVPPFLKGKGLGWLTAEYSMLPASTGRRKQRDGIKKDGRGVEISRLIGRALRQAVDRRFLGERTVTIDCDVLEADGGTRTASITGGFVALCCAVDKLIRQGKIKESPIVHQIAAVSAGIVEDVPCLDLCYLEDSAAQTDMNFVMDETGAFIELQGTGEGRAFTRGELAQILSLGEKGIGELHEIQRQALGSRARHIAPRRTLVIASNNAHKIQEISDMVEDRMNVISMKEAGFEEDIDENGDTFEENAAIKARAVAKATGFCALGDDSGLSVDALDGAPGVHSARYCGRHGDDKANNDLLIANMADIPAEDRTAEFVCAMALSLPNGEIKTVRGTCPGVITFTPRGEGGFGYDPYFEYLSGETFAEMAQEEKNRISHRANAMRLMLPYLEEL
jgi:XTP/dITP diphosphohydrolase